MHVGALEKERNLIINNKNEYKYNYNNNKKFSLSNPFSQSILKAFCTGGGFNIPV